MKKCMTCGHESDRPESKCPACGNYYSKVLELIAEEEEYEEKNSLRSRCRRILNAENTRQEMIAELKAMMAGMTGKAKFTLLVIFAFVFALIISVL